MAVDEFFLRFTCWLCRCFDGNRLDNRLNHSRLALEGTFTSVQVFEGLASRNLPTLFAATFHFGSYSGTPSRG